MASAQSQVTSSTDAARAVSKEEAWELRLQYGIVSRSGGLTDSGPGLTYTGITPNDLALRGWLWFLFDVVGVGLSLEREAFALYDNGVRVTGGGLLRAHIGPTGRLRLGPVRLEALAGYAFHQLPDFGSTTSAPTFMTGSRHAIMLAARALLDLGPVTIEGRFEYPLALATTNAAGASMPMPGFTVGGGVRLALARTGKVVWGAMADASYSTDNAPRNTAYQSLIRAGLALDLQWKDEPIVIRTGTVNVGVKGPDGKPLGRAIVSLETPSGPLSPPLDETGHAILADVLAGHVTAHAKLDGYEPADAEGDLAVLNTLALDLTMQKTPPKVGGLVVMVTDKITRAPLPNVSMKMGDQTYTTDDAGKVVIHDLNPGPVNLAFNADGYQPGSEAASIVAGVDSTVEVGLLSAKKRELATITGLVRSGRGGAPIQANLEIPEAKIKAKANAVGAFTFKVVGGTYTVNISGKGFLSQTKQLIVKDAEQAILNVDLQPK